jgi:hypothetical protein
MSVEVQNALDKFGSSVIKQSRTQLSKKGKNASKALWDSLGYKVKVSKNSFQLDFFMEDYGKFIDKGVTGKNASNFKGKKKTVQKSLAGYHFGSGKFKGKSDQWKKRIDKWMFSRGIAPRDKDSGKFVKRDTVNYLIRRSIYQHGSKATEFFTRPLEVAFKQFPDEVVEAYGLTVDKLLKLAVQ